ncbi:MAG: DUF2953 domain-containing protein [Lachnospiraceae bacterium]|nr:DUF2953 domain-containing protein [Lachnospiraceae bacterium]
METLLTVLVTALSVILKILLILLIIIGVIILLLFILLISPFRYKIKFEKNDELMDDYHGSAVVSYLAFIVWAKVTVINSAVDYKIKLFGIPVQGLVKRLMNKSDKNDKDDEDDYYDDSDSDSTSNITGSANDTNADNADSDDIAEALQQDIKACQDSSDNKKDKKKKSKEKKSKKDGKGIFQTIKEIFSSIKRLFKRLKDDTENVIEKIRRIKGEFKRDVNKRGFKYIKKVIGKTLKKLKPRKFNCDIVYGFDDPALTGEVLGGFAIAGSIHKDRIKVRPDFTRKVFEADVFIKGKIRLMTLVIAAIKLVTNKDVKSLYGNFKKLKEEL